MGSSWPLGMATALYRHISRSFSASPALRWWPPTLARPSFPRMAAPNPPIHRASRFSHGPRSMVPISSVPGDESVKPYRRLPISSGKAINVLQGNSKNIENIETNGTISLVDEYEMRSEKDASRTNSGVIDGKHDECGQNMNLSGSKEDQRSATKDHTAEIVGYGFLVEKGLSYSRP